MRQAMPRGGTAPLVVIVALLTAAIVTYPFELEPAYTRIQAIQAIPALGTFAAIFLLWLAALVWGLLRAEPRVQGVLLLAFSIGYLGFWTFNAPDGRFEDWTNMSTVAAIVSAQRVVQDPHYWLWPGLGIVGALVSVVAGTEPVSIRSPLVLATGAGLVLLLFAFLRTVIPHRGLAAVGTVAAVVSNMLLVRFHFFPLNFAHLILLTGLILVLRAPHSSWSVGVTVITAGLAVTHFASSVLLVMTLIVARVIADRSRIVAVVAAMVVVVGWQVYWAWPLVTQVAAVTRELIRSIGRDGLAAMAAYSLAVLRINVAAGEIPAWLTATRWTWIVGIYIAPILIALRAFRSDGAHPGLRLCGGWTLGLVVVTAVAMLFSPGGEQFHRYLYFGSVFTVPLVADELRRWFGARAAAAVFATVVVVLGLPSFLGGGNLSRTFSYYPSQVGAGKWMRATFIERGDQPVRVFGVGPGWSVALYYGLKATVERPPMPDDSVGAWFEEHLRKGYQGLVTRYRSGVNAGEKPLLWIDPLAYAYFSHWFGVEGVTGLLDAVEDGVARTLQIYDNGFVRMATVL